MTEIARLKLYHYPATRSARVKWMLHEVLDDDFDIEVVPLYEGAQYEAEYLQKNPNHAVPALEITLADGGIAHMFESGAMVTWLADAYPDKGLAPAPQPLSLARADYLQMIHFGASWIDMMLWQVRSHEHLLPASQRDPRTAERYRNKLRNEAEPQLIARLQKTPYICGDEFTAADCIIGHDVMWAKGYGMCSDEVFSGYLSKITKRPAFIKAFSDVGGFSLEPPAGSPVVERFSG